MEMSYYTLKSTREIASCRITILIMPIELLNSFNLQHYRFILLCGLPFVWGIVG